MQNNINVTVVHATADQQIIRLINIPANSTIRAALLHAQLFVNIDQLHVGIFGKLRSLDCTLQDGDRIEIYRSLHIDPKDARMQRVQQERKAKRMRRQQEHRSTT